MDEDSRIKRLREYVQLYLRRKQKVNNHDKHRIQILSKKSIAELGESKTSSIKSRTKRKILKINKLMLEIKAELKSSQKK